MVYAASNRHRTAPAIGTLPRTAKILIAGGFGAGKTTLVGAVSEIRPLKTEEYLTQPGHRLDPLTHTPAKTTTTVAMDFGRITLPANLTVYLFGMPGQHRFWFMWDELTHGAIGAIIIADTRRLADSFPAIDYFEHAKTPFIIAINRFDGAPRHPTHAISTALALNPQTPVIECDARQQPSSRNTLITLIEHTIKLARTRPHSA